MGSTLRAVATRCFHCQRTFDCGGSSCGLLSTTETVGLPRTPNNPWISTQLAAHVWVTAQHLSRKREHPTDHSGK